MRRLLVFAFVTVDGVMQGPGGPDEDPTGEFAHGGWAVNHWDDAMYARMSEFHAALALRGLPGIDQRIARRNQIRLRYERQLGSVPGITFQQIRSGCRTTAKDFSLIVDQAGMVEFDEEAGGAEQQQDDCEK